MKIPDENLTPQQRQHREEQLARLRNMQQMLFPENAPDGGVGGPGCENPCPPGGPGPQGMMPMPHGGHGGPHPGGMMMMPQQQQQQGMMGMEIFLEFNVSLSFLKFWFAFTIIFFVSS